MNERPRIGLSGLVLAEVLADDENGITYGTPFRIPGAVVATINPNFTGKELRAYIVTPQPNGKATLTHVGARVTIHC